ncbi:hypothetical protein [Hahella sp. KA22]|uniref:hypothetical protein n=2 Tax=Hahella sp. KA22 TaxID=1628392 RepID=UPI000FDD29BC|nr:hypothetical protein [Hahella sp. KA22]AZZ94947.1 hypothetical protein ENC22_28635 [Hahella sp. KA22]
MEDINMTIYRIIHEESYLTFEIPTGEILEKLGREYPFHIKRAPVPYHAVWKPLNIKFKAAESRAKNIPDIAARNGRLFFNEKAYKALSGLLAQVGEFLLVNFDESHGYLFNPLRTAEEVDGVDRRLTAYDANQNLVNITFDESKVGGFPIFRTELDTFQGIFCNEAFAEAYRQSKLTGIFLHSDLSNPLGESYGVKH